MAGAPAGEGRQGMSTQPSNGTGPGAGWCQHCSIAPVVSKLKHDYNSHEILQDFMLAGASARALDGCQAIEHCVMPAAQWPRFITSNEQIA